MEDPPTQSYVVTQPPFLHTGDQVEGIFNRFRVIRGLVLSGQITLRDQLTAMQETETRLKALLDQIRGWETEDGDWDQSSRMIAEHVDEDGTVGEAPVDEIVG